MRTALSIAGSDPSGGAGIQADIKTFHAHGIFGMSAITAVTVQNTQKVYSVNPINADIVFNQIVCLFEDTEIHGIKIGMVYDVKQIKAIEKALSHAKLPPVILDPVMISKSGHPLLKNSAIDTLVRSLFPIADVVTPNINEA
jgi:hydroxymethylpyrimidine/phosphomethylpyrimidine kinase